MNELKFSSISDIGIFFLTIPGHLYNLLKSLVTFIVIDLAIVPVGCPAVALGRQLL